MAQPALVDRVAKAIWGKDANKRVVTWAQMPEHIKELWRVDAKRALAAVDVYQRETNDGS